MATETEKGHGLLYVIWKLRKASALLNFRLQGLRTRQTKDVSVSLSLKPWEHKS